LTEEDKKLVHTIPDDDEVVADTPQAELLAWHYRLGHLSFERIRQMAERGDLPSRLMKCKTPKCAACMFGKATRRPWRTRAPVNRFKSPPANRPGDVVAVDQLISSTPGLIGQMKGFITRKRYTVTTVFVDHFSGLSFVHFQLSTSVAETVVAKRTFERYAKAHGVKIKHYHADNGVFAAKGFVEEIQHCGQTISYCAVNAHHQNGKAEKRIRDLQETARTMMLHAKQRWPTAVTTNLWPYAIRMANDIANAAPSIQHKHTSPIEMFAQVEVAPRVKHSHTFGSPVYVLDKRAQQQMVIPKWEAKARIGLYLGASPRH
jgi:GAG-pre-integrase domain